MLIITAKSLTHSKFTVGLPDNNGQVFYTRKTEVVILTAVYNHTVKFIVFHKRYNCGLDSSTHSRRIKRRIIF